MDPENPKRLGFRYNGQDYWYIQNGQGDIAGILDSTGTQVVSYTYDSWGVPVSVTGSMADTIRAINPFRYRGYYYDFETGLYYLNSRYYDPVVGRFLSADDESLILVSPDGLTDKNLFSYCDNNPIIRVDTEGEFWTLLIGAGMGALFSLGRQLLLEGKSWDQLNVVDIITSAASGALAFTPLKLVGQVAVNAGLSIVSYAGNNLIKGEEITVEGVVGNGLSGALSGFLGGKGTNGKALEQTWKHAGRTIQRETRRQNTKYAAKRTLTAQAERQAVKHTVATTVSRFYASGMAAFLTYSQAMNYGLL